MTLVPFSTRLDDDLIRKLKGYSLRKGISMQEAIKQILESHLKKEATE